MPSYWALLRQFEWEALVGVHCLGQEAADKTPQLNTLLESRQPDPHAKTV
jgi:hypothetical protein